MTTVTFEQIQAAQATAAALIEQFQKQTDAAKAPPTRIELKAFGFDLHAGERYAGSVLDEGGWIKHLLVLLPAKPGKDLDWNAAKAWAAEVGGDLPTRQEAALLYANCKPHLQPVWHWTSEPEGSGYAWYCDFDGGGQDYDGRSAEGAAVAVRRLNP